MANKRKVLVGLGMAVGGADGLCACANASGIAHCSSRGDGANNNGRFSTHTNTPAHLYPLTPAHAHAPGTPHCILHGSVITYLAGNGHCFGNG
ncbi:MAG: hypothetical protein R3C62_10505 [Chloroflexota bacterium]